MNTFFFILFRTNNPAAGKKMKLNPDFVNLLSEVTSRAAIASYPFIGSGDKYKADQAAVNIMRQT